MESKTNVPLVHWGIFLRFDFSHRDICLFQKAEQTHSLVERLKNTAKPSNFTKRIDENPTFNFMLVPAVEKGGLNIAHCLSAFEDVERSLAAYVFAVQKTTHLKQAVADRTRALTLAQKRFDSGLDNFFEVLDAQRRLAASKNTLASARSEALNAQVGVYQSIGGGWEVAEQTLVSEQE